MNDRVGELRAWLEPEPAAAFLVTASTNVDYLSGFSSSSAAALVSETSVHLFTDGRYAEAVSSVDGVESVILERNLLGELGRILRDYTPGPVAFEAGRMSVAEHESLSKSGLELVAAAGVLETIRAVKDADELASIRAAASILSGALERVPQMNPVGRTERELAWLLERTMREDGGAESLSFPAIVASGANSARPHHAPSDRTIAPDEVLLIDAGCVVDGYCSDCTRVYATGELRHELVEAYAACLEIQERAVAAVEAGVDTKTLDEEHREALVSHGYSVDHSLGHGVGREIHEEPRLARTASTVLKSGHVVTIEPGVYLRDLGGIRIEDMVAVTMDGGDILTPVTKDLVQVS